MHEHDKKIVNICFIDEQEIKRDNFFYTEKMF